MKFSYKIFNNGNETLLAIADKSILGKEYSKDGLVLVISNDFYHQAFCSEEEALKMIENATSVNAMGKGIVDILVKNNIIGENNVLRPCGVPHAQIVKI